ncbi:MAG: IS256 family transposase, partial [Nannocystaceae bacterium]
MLKILEKNTKDEDGFTGQLDALVREGARRMLLAALEVEVEDYVCRHAGQLSEDGRRLVVRNGHAQARKITTGAGTIAVKAPRVNDKRIVDGERQ